MNEFYVYAHYKEDPIANPLAVPYYIGKGMTNRLTKTFGRSSHHKNIIKKYGLWTRKLDENLTEEQAFEAECFYISEIGRKDLNKGPLINLTDGGDGSAGHLSPKATPCVIATKDYCKWFKSYTEACNYYGLQDFSSLKSQKIKSLRTKTNETIFMAINSKYSSEKKSKLNGELDHSQYKIKECNFRGEHIKKQGLKMSKPCYIKYDDDSIKKFKSFSEASRENGLGKNGNSNLIQFAKGQSKSVTLLSKTTNKIIIGVGYSRKTIVQSQRIDKTQLLIKKQLTKQIKLTYEDGSIKVYNSQTEANIDNGLKNKCSLLRELEKQRIKKTFSKSRNLWIISVITLNKSINTGVIKGIYQGINITNHKDIIKFKNQKDIKSAGFIPSNICSCISGRQKSHKGYIWSRI